MRSLRILNLCTSPNDGINWKEIDEIIIQLLKRYNNMDVQRAIQFLGTEKNTRLENTIKKYYETEKIRTNADKVLDNIPFAFKQKVLRRYIYSNRDGVVLL